MSSKRDGDPFKMWYGWAYSEDKETFQMCRNFFRDHLINGSFGFPDKYVVLHIGQDELTNRKVNDGTRTRGGFQKHLQFIEPQKRYFQAMNSFYPGYVEFIEATSVQRNVEIIIDCLSRPANWNPYSIDFFDYMLGWMENNSPKRSG